MSDRISEYRPWLLHRVNLVLHESGKRLKSFMTYDYMGSAEYEFGAVPNSLARIRMRIMEQRQSSNGEKDGMLLIELESDKLVAKHGPYAGKRLHVLVSSATWEREQWRADFIEAMEKLADDQARSKEPAYMSDAFKIPRFGSPHHVDVWHDLKNDLFLAFSYEVLALVTAHLTRDFAFENANSIRSAFSGGDEIVFVKAKRGMLHQHEVSAENWKIGRGKIMGMTDEFVTVASHGDRFQVPWNMVITCPDAAQGCTDPEMLKLLKESASKRH